MARFRSKLTATVLPVVLVGFAVSTAVAVSSASRAENAAAAGRSADVTQAQAERVAALTRTGQQSALTLAAVASSVVGTDRASLRSQVAGVVRATKIAVDAYVDFLPDHAPGKDADWRGKPGMTESGRFVTAYIRDGDKPAQLFPWDDATDREAEKQQWFVGPMTTGKLTTTEPYVDPGSHILMTSFTAPITTATGERIGVAGIDVALTDLSQQLGSVQVGQHGYELLVSAKGVVLAAPANRGGTPDVIGAKTLTDAVSARTKATAGEILRRAEGAAAGNVNAADPFGSQDALISWTEVPSTGWTLITVIPRAEIDAPVSALRHTLELTALLVLLGVAGVVIVAAARLTRPLPRVRDAALQIAEGNLDVKLPAAGRDELGEVSAAFAAIVTSLRAARDSANQFAHVRALADADELTGIANRRRFFELAERDVNIAAKDGRQLIVMMVDIDYFKRVNDTYGHPTGDDVIRGVADRLSYQIRSGDIISRYGGEEFALVLLNADSNDDLPERLRSAVAGAPIPTRSGALSITISIGIAAMEPGQPNLTALIARADEALYRAKENGRNCVLAG